MMGHEQAINELSDGVASELVMLASRKNYPINPYVGLLGFVEGFKSWGVPVHLNEPAKRASFIFHLNSSGIDYRLPVECSYQQILNGMGNSVRGSPCTFLDSSMRIIRSAERILLNNYGLKVTEEQRVGFAKGFIDKAPIFISALTDVWKDSFQKYHEHVLISPEGGIPALKESDILPIVLKQIDWDEYDEVARRDVSDGSETAAFRGYFNILFFAELARKKGYPLEEVSPGKEPYDPLDFFVNGKDIPWRNLPVIK